MKYYIYQAIFSVLVIVVISLFFNSFSGEKTLRNYIIGDSSEIDVVKNVDYQMSFEAQESKLDYIRLNINSSKSSLTSSDKVYVTLADDNEKTIAYAEAYLYNGERNYVVIDFDGVTLEKGEWYYLTFDFDGMSPMSLLCLSCHNVSSFTDAFTYGNQTDDTLSFDLPIGFSKVANISYYYSQPDVLCLLINLAVFAALIGLLFVKKYFKNRSFVEIYRTVYFVILVYIIGEVLNVEKLHIFNIFYPLSVKQIFCFIVSLCIILFFYLFLYTLIGNGTIAQIVSAFPFILLAYVNHSKLVMRGDSFMPWDLLSAGIGLKTGSTYYFHVTKNFVCAIMLCVALLIFIRVTYLSSLKVRKTRFTYCLLFLVTLFFIFSSFVFNTKTLKNLKIYYEVNPPIQSYNENGTYLAFLMHINNIEAKGGTNNSPEKTEEIIYRYTGIASSMNLDSRVNNNDFQPNVICIMSEAFSDPRSIRYFETSQPFMPYYDSLRRETIHGKIAVSIFGGGTCNTEFEFLTGYSVANLLPGASVYSFYINNETEALPAIFHENGYRTVALHPFDGSWWDRSEKYPMIGFDEFYTRDDFDESASYVRRYISDYSTFEKITDIYEESEEPLFLFCVTMQNHADFSARYDNMNYNIELTNLRDRDGNNYYYAENYLSLLRESDDALEYLIEYLRNSDEPTIVCFFGDHCPTLDGSFYSELLQTDVGSATLEESIPMYETPYFIWANYDLSSGGTTIRTNPANYGVSSANFLGQTVLDLAGITSPDSRSCLRVLQQYVTGMSSLAVFTSEGYYVNVNDMDPEVVSMLEDYASLEYGLVYFGEDISYPEQTTEN